MNNIESTTFIEKLTTTYPLLRKLGVAYITLSASMFMFGFVSTLIYKLG